MSEGARDRSHHEAGHGPADPRGYAVTQQGGGYVWTRRTDEQTGGPYPTREEAVAAAWADHDTALPEV